MPSTVAPTSLAYCTARTRFGLTLRSRLPPPTENTRIASPARSWLTFSHAENVVSQPSSLVRAVSSETLSVGAYASIPTSLRKSLTACEALPALPPTPRMNSRAPRSRSGGELGDDALDGIRIDAGDDLAGLGEKRGGKTS